MSRRSSIIIAFTVLAVAIDLRAQTTQPDRDLDESAFRDALRQRGLTDWLDQYLADTPPVSPVDEQLRRREHLLAEAALASTSRRVRQVQVREASQILSALIEKTAQPSLRGDWQLEIVRDALDREDPLAFDAVLIYELPGKDRLTVARLSEQASRMLKTIRDEVAASWKSLEELDERHMAEAVRSGLTRTLENLDGQSLFLLAWADFYRALSTTADDPQRPASLAALLETVTQRYGWTVPAPGREVQRCSALIMAAVASRLGGHFVEARQLARDTQEAVSQVRDPTARQGLGKIVLLAVLEQIRALRDAGKLDEARSLLDEARAWASQSRPDDITTQLALALTERGIVLRRTSAGTANSTSSPPASAEALLPLQRIAAISPSARDMLYEIMAGTYADQPVTPAGSLFELQLMAGSIIADAAAAPPPSTGGGRIDGQLISALTEGVRPLPALVPADVRGELMFLLARAHYLGGAPLEAARVLCDLVEQHPQHDRAAVAVEQAAAIAQDALRQPGPAKDAARTVFIRAGRLLRKQQPDSPASRQLQFFIAAALDDAKEYEAAAEEYAAVPADDARALRAAWGRARCLRDALNLLPASRPADDPAAKRLVERARDAARAAVERAGKTPDADACLSADITLILAGVLNHPLVAQPAEALKAIEQFESRHAQCPAAIASALRERVSALRQLKRMPEARAAMEQFLAADPDNAGPLMARLLDAMREEIESTGDRGDAAARKSIAEEAAHLAERLQSWAAGHPGRMSENDVQTVALWQAWAMLEAGHAETALGLYDRLSRSSSEASTGKGPLGPEIRLGRAECLLSLGKPPEALPLFTAAWQAAPEGSANWWRAYVGTIRAHTALKHDARQIVQSIRQQRQLSPGLGGPRWKRELEQLEGENAAATAASAPAP